MRFCLLMLGLLFTPLAHAGVEFRLLGSLQQIKADEMNSFYSGQSLKEIHQLPGIKLDMGFNPLSRLYLGLRFSLNRLHLGDGLGGPTGDVNYSKLIYESYGPYLRLYILSSKFLRLDVFGGAGGTRVMVTSKELTIEQNQGLRENDLRFMQFAGGSISIGVEKFMILLEGGYDWAKVKSLSYYSANASPRIGTIDLTGPYAGLGVSFRY